MYNISIGNLKALPGIYHVTLKNLNVNCNNGPVLQIYENSTVYLTLEGSSQLNVQNENLTAIFASFEQHTEHLRRWTADREQQRSLR